MQPAKGRGKDALAGLFYLTTGAAFAWASARYPLGSVVRIGPGFFPMMLAILLMLVGAAVVLRSFVRDSAPVGTVAWRGLVCVVAAVLLFAGLAEAAGLGIATFAASLVGSAGSPAFRWHRSLLLALGLAIGCVVVFVVLLGLPLPALPAFLAG